MEEKKNSGFGIHAVIALIIVAILCVCAYKLWKWDNSGDIELETVSEGEYAYESLDVVFTVDKDILAERGDDGVNTILCIGDGIWYQQDQDGYCFDDFMKSLPDSKVIKIANYKGKIADVQNAYQTDDVTPWQAVNLYDVVKAIVYRNFSLQKAAYQKDMGIDENFYETITSVDMNKVDTCFIMYGSSDYVAASVLYNPNDKFDTTTYDGALRASIKLIQEKYPHIRVIVGSPYLHGVIQNETVVPATMVNYGNGNLSEYVMRSYNIAMECCISYVDLFFGLIDEDNMNFYCNVDSLNPEGVRLLSDHIVEFMKRKY